MKRAWLLAGLALFLASSCGDDGDGKALYCYGFLPGEKVDPHIGGSARSRVTVQATADVAAIVAVDIIELTSACRRLAAADGATASDIALSDLEADPDKRASGMCGLAGAKVKARRPAAATCIESVSDRADCLIACPGCDVVCDMVARARASCVGADRSDLSDLVALQAHLDSIADASGAFTSALNDAIDIKAACVPVVIAQLGTTTLSASHAHATIDEVFASP